MLSLYNEVKKALLCINVGIAVCYQDKRHLHSSCSGKPAQHERCKCECCEGFTLQLEVTKHNEHLMAM